MSGQASRKSVKHLHARDHALLRAVEDLELESLAFSPDVGQYGGDTILTEHFAPVGWQCAEDGTHGRISTATIRERYPDDQAKSPSKASLSAQSAPDDLQK